MSFRAEIEWVCVHGLRSRLSQRTSTGPVADRCACGTYDGIEGVGLRSESGPDRWSNHCSDTRSIQETARLSTVRPGISFDVARAHQRQTDPG